MPAFRAWSWLRRVGGSALSILKGFILVCMICDIRARLGRDREDEVPAMPSVTKAAVLAALEGAETLLDLMQGIANDAPDQPLGPKWVETLDKLGPMMDKLGTALCFNAYAMGVVSAAETQRIMRLN